MRFRRPGDLPSASNTTMPARPRRVRKLTRTSGDAHRRCSGGRSDQGIALNLLTYKDIRARSGEYPTVIAMAARVQAAELEGIRFEGEDEDHSRGDGKDRPGAERQGG